MAKQHALFKTLLRERRDSLTYCENVCVGEDEEGTALFVPAGAKFIGKAITHPLLTRALSRWSDFLSQIM
jgi:hypothetical protein